LLSESLSALRLGSKWSVRVPATGSTLRFERLLRSRIARATRAPERPLALGRLEYFE